MVGLIAGIANLDNAFLRAEACISKAKRLDIRVHCLTKRVTYAWRGYGRIGRPWEGPTSWRSRDDLRKRSIGRHRSARDQSRREPNTNKHSPPSSASIMDADLKLPGQPIQIPRGPAHQLSNGVYSRDGQARASLIGIPVYQASVRVHQST